MPPRTFTPGTTHESGPLGELARPANYSKAGKQLPITNPGALAVTYQTPGLGIPYDVVPRSLGGAIQIGGPMPDGVAVGVETTFEGLPRDVGNAPPGGFTWPVTSFTDAVSVAAKISFGAGSGPAVLEVDATPGSMIALHGMNVTVELFTELTRSNTNASVAAFISYGVETGQPQRTLDAFCVYNIVAGGLSEIGVDAAVSVLANLDADIFAIATRIHDNAFPEV